VEFCVIGDKNHPTTNFNNKLGISAEGYMGWNVPRSNKKTLLCLEEELSFHFLIFLKRSGFSTFA